MDSRVQPVEAGESGAGEPPGGRSAVSSHRLGEENEWARHPSAAGPRASGPAVSLGGEVGKEVVERLLPADLPCLELLDLLLQLLDLGLLLVELVQVALVGGRRGRHLL